MDKAIPSSNPTVKLVISNKNLPGWLPGIVERLTELHKLDPGRIDRVEGFIDAMFDFARMKQTENRNVFRVVRNPGKGT
jgi:hypothetical protein